MWALVAIGVLAIVGAVVGAARLAATKVAPPAPPPGEEGGLAYQDYEEQVEVIEPEMLVGAAL